jgi:hypothetical protein
MSTLAMRSGIMGKRPSRPDNWETKMRFGKLTLLAVAVGALSGCGIADHFQAESRMNQSQDAYRKCLGDNTGKPALCDPLKAVYERDKADFEK